jgi:hypothetical protein
MGCVVQCFGLGVSPAEEPLFLFGLSQPRVNIDPRQRRGNEISILPLLKKLLCVYFFQFCNPPDVPIELSTIPSGGLSPSHIGRGRFSPLADLIHGAQRSSCQTTSNPSLGIPLLLLSYILFPHIWSVGRLFRAVADGHAHTNL